MNRSYSLLFILFIVIQNTVYIRTDVETILSSPNQQCEEKNVTKYNIKRNNRDSDSSDNKTHYVESPLEIEDLFAEILESMNDSSLYDKEVGISLRILSDFVKNDSNNLPGYDSLSFSLEINSSEKYLLGIGIVLTEKGSDQNIAGIGYSEQITPVGIQNRTVEVPGRQIHSSDISGPYNVSIVVFFERQVIQVYKEVYFANSSLYEASNFDDSGISFMEQYLDWPVDNDPDEFFEGHAIRIGIQSILEGTFIIAILFEPEVFAQQSEKNSILAYAYTQITLGENQVILKVNSRVLSLESRPENYYIKAMYIQQIEKTLDVINPNEVISLVSNRVLGFGFRNWIFYEPSNISLDQNISSISQSDPDKNGKINTVTLNFIINASENEDVVLHYKIADKIGQEMENIMKDEELQNGSQAIKLNISGALIYQFLNSSPFSVKVRIFDKHDSWHIYPLAFQIYECNLSGLGEYENVTARFQDEYADQLLSDTSKNDLEIRIGVQVEKSGQFIFEGYLIPTSVGMTEASLRWASVVELSEGYTNLSQIIDGRLIQARGISGPFLLRNLRIIDQSNQTMDWRSIAPFSTYNYSLQDFGQTVKPTIDTYGWFILDDDLNGVNDTLVLNITITSTVTGNFSIRSTIGIPPYHSVVNSSYVEFLSPGTQVVTCNFSSKVIWKQTFEHMLFFDKIILSNESKITLIHYSHSWIRLSPKGFEITSKDSSFVGVFRDRGIDEDKNGFYECLIITIGMICNETGYYSVEANLSTANSIQINILTPIYCNDEYFELEIKLNASDLFLSRHRAPRSGENESFALKDLYLKNESTGEIFDQINDTAYITKSYFTNSFEFENKTVDIVPPKIISGPLIQVLGEDEVIIGWMTDEPATSEVYYGVDINIPQKIIHPIYSTWHFILLQYLLPGTTYYYQIASSDKEQNGPTRSQIAKFSTPGLDTKAPVFLFGPQVHIISSEEVIITWITDELTDSQVSYGMEDMNYAIFHPEFNVSHQIIIDNLIPNTTYWFRAISTDKAGNRPTIVPGNFSTPPMQIPLTFIQEPEVIIIQTHSVTIGWSTNLESDALVFYGLDENYGAYTSNKSLVKYHTITLVGLASGRTFHAMVLSKAGSQTVRSEDFFFTTANSIPATTSTQKGDKYTEGKPPTISGFEIFVPFIVIFFLLCKKKKQINKSY